MKIKTIKAVAVSTVFILTFVITQFTLPGAMIVAIILEVIPGPVNLAVILVPALCIAIFLFMAFKNRWVGFGMLVLCFGGLVVLNAVSWELRDSDRMLRMKTMQNYLSELSKEGHLPEELEQNSSLFELSTGILGKDEIRYQKTGEHYEIWSYGVPLGPFDNYSSERREWYAEE